MDNVRSYKRKNYFIKKRLQGRYMLNTYLLIFLLVLVFALLISYSTSEYLTITYENYGLQVANTPASIFKHILATSWMIMIPLGLLMIWVVMRITHKIAGPMYKFESVLEQMGKGVLDPDIRLRKGDDGQEVMARLQQVNRFFSGKVQEIESLVNRLQNLPSFDNSLELQNLEKELQRSLADFEIKS